MKKRKVKRYEEGGKTEADYKREGLSASKGDKVGFLERLRMGNIDSPGSEAYYKYGAGRGKMIEESTKPVPEMSSDYSGRGAKMPEEDVSSSYATSGRMRASDIGYGGGEEDSKSPTESKTESVVEKIIKKRKPVKKMRKVDDQPVGSMGESSDYSGGRKSASAAPKSKFSDTGKSTRLRALLGTFGMKSGGKVSASSRADGIAQRGKTRGRIC